MKRRIILALVPLLLLLLLPERGIGACMPTHDDPGHAASSRVEGAGLVDEPAIHLSSACHHEEEAPGKGDCSGSSNCSHVCLCCHPCTPPGTTARGETGYAPPAPFFASTSDRLPSSPALEIDHPPV